MYVQLSLNPSFSSLAPSVLLLFISSSSPLLRLPLPPSFPLSLLPPLPPSLPPSSPFALSTVRLQTSDWKQTRCFSYQQIFKQVTLKMSRDFTTITNCSKPGGLVVT